MDTLLIMKKTIQSHTLYGYEILLSNIPVLLQVTIAISLGSFLNSTSHLFTLGELMTYYLGVAIINTFQRNGVLREFESEVSNGVISNYLTRPINFVWYKIIKEFASKLYTVLVNFGVILLIMFLFFEIPYITLGTIFRFILIIPLTIINFYAIMAIFMYLCLILEKAQNLYRIFGMSAFFIGGGLVPTSYFPKFLSYLPQQFLFGSPLEYVTTGVYTNWALGIAYFILWLVIIIVLHKYAIKRLETNGG